jgi:undecaprenyl-diphosphatase
MPRAEILYHRFPMEAIQSFLLGIVQGLTEFLPVSSSGHLVIAQALLGVNPAGGIVFEVAVHIATLVAILLFYRRRILALLHGALTGDGEAWRYVSKLAVATLPAVAVALVARDWIEQQFESPVVAGICLIATGGIVWTTKYTAHGATRHEPGWTVAVLIGCAQAFAILPGISRSGTTVAVAMALGIAPLAAAEFSFLLGVVAIAGAGVLLLPELVAVSATELNAIAIGGAASLVSGLIAIWLFLWLLRGRRFHLFSWYAWLVGVATLVAVFA